MNRRTILALDVGEARIGLARGDLGSSLAFGRGFITRGKTAEDIAAIKKIMAQEQAELLIVGLPKRSSGGDSAQTKRVRAFARLLKEAGINLEFEDERFTTRIATQGIVQSGLKKKKRQEKGRVDEASAILILESYLRRHSHQDVLE